jgi:glycosyltransferase involved in cell wall biosynthesis
MTFNNVIIISMPFNIGVGGFRRSYFVLPHLAKRLAEEYRDVELYIPANAVRTAFKYFLYLNEKCHWDSIIISHECLDFLENELIKSVTQIEKDSGYHLYINDKILAKSIELNIRILTKEIEKSKENSEMLIFKFFSERYRPLLMSIFEKSLWEYAKQHISRSYSLVYSQHETADSLTIASLIAKRAGKISVLLQSNIKEIYTRNILKTIKDKLMGFLAVSPQPIEESPFVTGFTKKFRVITPSVALDPTLLNIASKLEKPTRGKYRVIYFGRLSKDKGLADLLKAWEIVIEKIPQARLTLIGAPDSSEMLLLINRYKKKMKDSIKYLGFLRGERLYRKVANHDILAYPSYRDAFPLTVLESLALGLKVVAYDIPAIRYFFRPSSKVYSVKKGNVESFAISIVHGFLEEKEIDNYTKVLIKLHSSWERVAQAEFEALMSILA